MNTRFLNFSVSFLVISLLVYVLYVGKHLLIPLVIALVFWYIIVRLTELYQRIAIGQHHLPYGFALTCAILSTGIVLYLFSLLLTHSISNIIQEAPTYEKKLQDVLNFLDRITDSRIKIDELVSQINVTNLFSKLALILSNIASNFILILIYLLFLLLEHQSFKKKLTKMCNTEAQLSHTNKIINKIISDINGYLRVKVSINAIAGVLSYILLLAFGIDYAEFWGVLIFLLHFIPFIGPIVAIVFVLLAVSIQITSLLSFIFLAAILTAIQFAIGNFLEPKWMGTRLNLSPIVILLSLAFWGAIWGIIGMFLCVPIMVVISIILSKFPKTRPVAIMLSAEGNIE